MSFAEWRERLTADDGVELQAAAGQDDVDRVETALEAVFSSELRQLYAVSDGVFDGLGQWFVVWPLAEVLARNRDAWIGQADDAQRRALVGFGDDGTGAPFCVLRNGVGGVFVWSAIDGEATRLADTLAEFWTRRQAGSLPRY